MNDYGPDAWGWFWQNLPTDLLRDHPFQSLWYLHAQPPLWNALGAALLALFGTGQLAALQTLQILLGAATAALALILTSRLTGSRWWGLAAGALIGLHPALFLYEAYALYTVLAAFGVILAGALLERAGRLRSWNWALGFVATISALILTRSLFHLVLMVGAVPLALLVAGRPTRRQASILVVLVLVPAGWYAKNEVQYGFFGASSWYGMSLWRTALYDQDPATLRSLYDARALAPVVRVTPFSLPSAYRRLGYDRTSPIPSLDRDDLENINIPAISRAYRQSALTLIRATPGQYLLNVLTAYGNFSAPSADFSQIEPNRQRISLHVDIADWLVGRPFVSAIEKRMGGGRYYGSLYFLLFPAVLLTYLLQLARAGPGAPGLTERVRRDAPALFLAASIFYTTAVGCLMELGENMRFRFMVEPAFIVVFLVVLHRMWGGNRWESRTD